MKAKKILALILTAILLISCSACTTEIVIELGEIPTAQSGTATPSVPTTPETPPTPSTPSTPSTPETPSTPSTPSTPTTPETPAQPDTNTAEATTAAASSSDTAPENSAPAATGAPQSTAEILAYYNTAANNIKAKATSVTRNYDDYRHDADKLVLPSLLQSPGEKLIGSFLKKNETPETFSGADAVKNFYLPGETYVSKLTEADIQSAECKDNGSEYEITIVAKTSQNPTYGQGVSAGFEIIKTEDVMNAASFIVKSFDTEYYNCTIRCKVDKATGNVTWINFATPIIMNVASSIGINATVGMTFEKDFTVTF